MDKSWISRPQNSPDYEQGIRGFINFAFERSSVGGKIICPCSMCRFKCWQTKVVVYDHLLYKKFPEGYTSWFYHGETIVGESTSSVHNVTSSEEGMVPAVDVVGDVNPIQNMINDAFGVDQNCANEVDAEGEGVAPTVTNEAKEYHELARDGETPLYEGCTNYSKLSFIVKLYHIKCLCKMTDKSMTMILELLHDAFKHAQIPSSFYEAKKTIIKLGLNYANIDSPPDGISRDQWALFLNYREKPETKWKCEQNRANRAKQDTTHTLGSMSIARMKWDEEKRLGRPVSRGEMYAISHKRKNGSFVNDVARQKNDLLNAQPGGASSEDAYTNVFGKEHPGRVRGVGFGVCPSKFFRSTTSSGRSTASSSSGAPSNADWQAMKLELQESKSKVKVLEEQIAFLYQLAGHQQPGCNNSAVNQVADVGSPPIEMRRSSSASHNGEGRVGSYST